MSKQAQFWQSMTVVGPVGSFLILLIGANLLGIFDHFQWIGQNVSPLEGFSILAIMLFPLAAFFFTSVQRDVVLSRMSQAWPTVTGTLDEWTSERRITRSGVLYVVSVKYTYEVAGQKYYGDRLSFSSPRIDSGELYDQLMSRYRVKGAVTVHYDPAEPADAVLEIDEALARQRLWRVWVLLGVPVLVAVLVALFV